MFSNVLVFFSYGIRAADKKAKAINKREDIWYNPACSHLLDYFWLTGESRVRGRKLVDDMVGYGWLTGDTDKNPP